MLVDSLETSSPSYSELLNLKPSTLNPFAVDRPGIPQQAAERLSEAEARWCLQGFTGLRLRRGFIRALD